MIAYQSSQFDFSFGFGGYRIVGSGAFGPDRANLILELKADDATSNLSSWPPTIGNSPSIFGGPTKVAGPNNHSAVRFDGVDDYVFSTTNSAQCTAIIVAKGNSQANFSGYFSQSTNGNNDFQQSFTFDQYDAFGKLAFQAYNAPSDDAIATGVSGYFVASGVATNTRRAFFLNGATIADATKSTTATPSDGVVIGARYFGTPSFFCSCDIAHVLLFSGAITDNVRQAWENYLGTLYGIAISH